MTNKSNTLLNLTTGTAAFMVAAIGTQKAMADDDFIAKVKSTSGEDNATAWNVAREQSPSVIKDLIQLIGWENTSTRKCAYECINQQVHSVGKDIRSAKCKAVVNALINVLNPDTVIASALALRWLSLIADDNDVAYIAKFLYEDNLFEEAVFCIERIQGQMADSALIAAVKKVPDANKARVCVALGHRKVEAAKDNLLELANSSDVDLALTAFEAAASMGFMPSVKNNSVSWSSLNDWQKGRTVNALLLMFDATIANEGQDIPKQLITGMLNNDSDELPEHLYCGVIVSSSKMDDSDIAKGIINKLSYEPSYIVRDTAAKTLISMKGESVKSALKDAEANADGKLKAQLSDIIKARA